VPLEIETTDTNRYTNSSTVMAWRPKGGLPLVDSEMRALPRHHRRRCRDEETLGVRPGPPSSSLAGARDVAERLLGAVAGRAAGSGGGRGEPRWAGGDAGEAA
jgi:hypothetical protein